MGVRAAGMSGAFTAVADDASAVFWNPGGLAKGAFFGLLIDRNTADEGSAGAIALVTPAVGLSYYRTATGELLGNREGFVTHNAGLTIVHSLTNSISVGTTWKLVQGEAGLFSTNKFDADLGVMAAGSVGKIGVSVRNLFEPKFTAPGGLIQLDRQIRLGLALNITRGSMVTADVDLTETAIPAETFGMSPSEGRRMPPRNSGCAAGTAGTPRADRRRQRQLAARAGVTPFTARRWRTARSPSGRRTATGAGG